MENNSALIVGATGLIGKALLQRLLASDYYNSVTVLVRREMPISNQKLIQKVVDFNELERHKDSIRADDIYCCLGTTMKKAGSQQSFYQIDFNYPLQIATIAQKNGARQFLLVSALGANTMSANYYTRVKGQVEQAISQLKFESVAIFRPSLLLGDRQETRVAEDLAKILFKALSFALVGPLRQYRAIEATQVALAMATVAQHHGDGINVFESEQIAKFLSPVS